MAVVGLNNNNLITDDVPANNTIWILGDSLLTDAANHYHQFKKRKGEPKDAGIADMQALYMESMYALRLVSPGIYTSHQAKNIPNIILNSLVDTLNVKAKVPHTIVIIVNDHRFWNNADLLTYQMDRLIMKFFKEIGRIIENRNLSLPPKAVNWDYPRLFITRALPLPNNMTRPYPRGFKANRRRYNRLLQRGEQQYNYKTINLTDFTCENSNKLFAPDGSITKFGYKQLWIGISDAIHKADNLDRILLNKAKAKKLALQTTLTSSEIADAQAIHSSSDLSDIEPLMMAEQEAVKKRKPAKRALINDFPVHGATSTTSTRTQQNDSPASAVSEYYTVQHKKLHMNNGRQQPELSKVGFQHQRPFNKKKKTFYKNKFWRPNQWN